MRGIGRGMVVGFVGTPSRRDGNWIGPCEEDGGA